MCWRLIIWIIVSFKVIRVVKYVSLDYYIFFIPLFSDLEKIFLKSKNENEKIVIIQNKVLNKSKGNRIKC